MWSMTIRSTRFFCDSRLSPICSFKAAKMEGPASGVSCRPSCVHWSVKSYTPSRKTELWAIDGWATIRPELKTHFSLPQWASWPVRDS